MITAIVISSLIIGGSVITAANIIDHKLHALQVMLNHYLQDWDAWQRIDRGC